MFRKPRRSEQRLERIQAVLLHIEAHLGERLNVPALAGIARISPFHFHRLFGACVGEAVSAHVRRLRLEKAACLLLFGADSITEVATHCGYATPAGFSRAFRRHFGLSPSELLAAVQDRRAAARNDEPLPEGPEFVELAAESLLAVRRCGPYPESRREAWSALRQGLARQGADPGQFAQYGMLLDWPEITPAPQLRYQAGVAAGLAPGNGLFRCQLAGGSYALFRYRGVCDRLQRAHESILLNWLPTAGFALRDAPTVHRYLDPVTDAPGPQQVRVEIRIPIAVHAGQKQAA